jgi:hypothetical protein
MKATIEKDVRARLAEKMGLLNGTIAVKEDASADEDDDEEFFGDDEEVIAEAR